MNERVALSFEDVCFAYAREEVLHNVTLTVEEGSLVAMVGPNGGGKSTLLKLALGLHAPSRGRVRVFCQTPEQACRRVGYVPQNLCFDPDFPVSALDVVLMGRVERRVAGPYRAADRQAAMTALERVDLQQLAARRFSGLSGGERQRVLIAQALVSEPDMLLLDEPTANVDPQLEHRIYDLLRDLNRNMTVVVVSHNLSVVTRHASHLACVNRTASLLPVRNLTGDTLRAVRKGDMAVLRHEISCHVLDASTVLREPHRAGYAARGERA